MDLASPHESVFSQLDQSLAVSGVLAIILMLIGLWTSTFRRSRMVLLQPAGGLLLASYGIAIWILYGWR